MKATLPRGKRILLSGGAGFIGTALISRLADDNELVVLDNLRRNALGKTRFASHENVELVEGDVRDEALVRKLMKGKTHVIHLASIAGVDTVMRFPVETMEVTLLGTRTMLAAARDAGGIERFIDFSTSEVFGSFAYKVSEGDLTTLGAVGEARWTYAVSKLATEHLAHNYYRQYGLPTVAIRPFNVFGPGQIGEGAVHHFVVRSIGGEPLWIHNDGSQIRSWCYIDDFIEGTLLALMREEAIGHSFNIGNPRATLTIYALAKQIKALSGSSSKIKFKPWPFADVDLRIPSIEKARELLDFEPLVDLEQGLAHTIDWYREQVSDGSGAESR